MTRGPGAGVMVAPIGQAKVSGSGALYTESRRTIMALGGTDGQSGPALGADLVNRQSFTLPFTPTRYRFRIRNSSVRANSVTATPYTLTGIWVGSPNLAGKLVWNGDFTAAPTQVAATTTIDPGSTGAEYVSGWITTPLPVPNSPFAVSIGLNTAAFTNAPWARFSGGPALNWQAATGSAISSVAGSQLASAITGAGGSLAAANNCLDVRIEWEYLGNNPIGFFIGTSQENGSLNVASVNYGNCGPDETWPGMVGLRLGHGIINGGVDSALSSDWAAGGSPSTHLMWSRFLDTTYPTLVWPGGCTPDYAVISIGINDAANSVSLATLQANIATIISNLNTLGIYRIYICTVSPSTGAGWSSGALQTAIASGLHTGPTSVIMAANVSNVNQVLPNGGYPGPSALWGSATGFWLGLPEMGNSGGPFAITSAAGAVTANLTLTVPTYTAPFGYQVGDPVLGSWEGWRKTYNHWIRQHVLGTMATLDISSITEAAPPGFISYYNTGLAIASMYQGGRVRPEWYGATSGPHPADPSMYEAWAQSISPQLIGV